MRAYGESVISPISVRPTTGINNLTSSVAASLSNTNSTPRSGNSGPVIWTGLKANWPKGKALTFATVDAYVSGQSLIDRAGIKNYVRRTPAQVDTSLRRNIEEAYGLRRIPVPASCFEDGIEEF